MYLTMYLFPSKIVDYLFYKVDGWLLLAFIYICNSNKFVPHHDNIIWKESLNENHLKQELH